MKPPFTILTALLLLAGFAHAQTKIDPDFVRFKNLADGCFNRQDYACAETNYRAALIIKSNDSYCKSQISTIAQRKKAAVADQKRQAETKRREDAQRREQAAEKARLAKANQQAQAELEAERQRLAAERAELQRQREAATTPPKTDPVPENKPDSTSRRIIFTNRTTQTVAVESEPAKIVAVAPDSEPVTLTKPTAKTAAEQISTKPKPRPVANAPATRTATTRQPTTTPKPANTAPTAIPSTQLAQLRAEIAYYRSKKNAFLGMAVAAVAAGGITYVIANGKYSTYATEVASRNSTYIAQYASIYPGQPTPSADLLTPLSKGSYMGSSVAVAGGAIAGGVVFWLVSNGAARKYRATRNRLGSFTNVTPLYNPAQQWAGVSVAIKF